MGQRHLEREEDELARVKSFILCKIPYTEYSVRSSQSFLPKTPKPFLHIVLWFGEQGRGGGGGSRTQQGNQPLAVEAQLDLQRFHPERKSEEQICPYNFGTGIKRSAVPFEMDFAYKRADEHQKHVSFIQSNQYTRHSNSEVKMDCGFLLMPLGNFGPQPWSGWTNRAV